MVEWILAGAWDKGQGGEGEETGKGRGRALKGRRKINVVCVHHEAHMQNLTQKLDAWHHAQPCPYRLGGVTYLKTCSPGLTKP